MWWEGAERDSREEGRGGDRGCIAQRRRLTTLCIYGIYIGCIRGEGGNEERRETRGVGGSVGGSDRSIEGGREGEREGGREGGRGRRERSGALSGAGGIKGVRVDQQKGGRGCYRGGGDTCIEHFCILEGRREEKVQVGVKRDIARNS